MQDTLNMIKTFQRNWIYLDNIFQSNDIRVARPNDYSQFVQVDKWWDRKMKGFLKAQDVRSAIIK